MSKPIVYIASPYSKGDAAINTHCQLRAFDDLMTDGIVWPVAPLFSHFQHLMFPRQYRDWIEYDLALLQRYDACLRLNAEHKPLGYLVTESSGADGEVKAFEAMGKPVFYSKDDLYAWAANDARAIEGLDSPLPQRAGRGAELERVRAAEGADEGGWVRHEDSGHPYWGFETSTSE